MLFFWTFFSLKNIEKIYIYIYIYGILSSTTVFNIDNYVEHQIGILKLKNKIELVN